MISRVAIAFSLPGSSPVFVFSLLIGAGAALGLGSLILNEASRSTLPAGIVMLAASLTGASLGYRLIEPATPFFPSPFSGLSWGGAFAGGAAGLLLSARMTRQPLRRLADQMLPLAASLTITAWLGCWVDGCAYGAASDAWFAVPARDEWGNVAQRIPLQALGPLLAVATLMLVDFIAARLRREGTAAGLWLALTGAQFAWLHRLRVDPVIHWQGVRPDVWAAWAILAAGVLVLLFAFFLSPPETNS